MGLTSIVVFYLAIVMGISFFVIFAKERASRLIEKNTFKSEMIWYSHKGQVENRENVIMKRSLIPVFGDWVRIYPVRNEDESINWFNFIFGGKKNFAKLLIIFAIIALSIWWIYGTIGAGKEYLNGDKYVIVEKPLFDKYCSSMKLGDNSIIMEQNGNLSAVWKINNTKTS